MNSFIFDENSPTMRPARRVRPIAALLYKMFSIIWNKFKKENRTEWPLNKLYSFDLNKDKTNGWTFKVLSKVIIKLVESNLLNFKINCENVNLILFLKAAEHNMRWTKRKLELYTKFSAHFVQKMSHLARIEQKCILNKMLDAFDHLWMINK